MTEVRTALVTGSSRGIGREIARALARDGFRVAVHYSSSKEEAESLAVELGGGSAAFSSDLSVPGGAEALASAVKAHYGTVDVLVNNAGLKKDALLLLASPDDMRRTLEANLVAPMILTKLLARGMMKSKWGRIVNLSSVVARTGNPGQATYSASKGGIEALTRTSAMELAGFGVTVNTVAPGLIATDMTASMPKEALAKALAMVPAGRAGLPAEVAAVVSFLCSESASYVTGATLPVGGGLYFG